MILVTVGAQMPFDRLIQAVDAWAGSTGRGDVLAQIGPGGWRPRNIQWTEFLAPSEFEAKVDAASVLVAHAGMGSILTALVRGRPILVMPRRGDLRETRNDHQVATARKFEAQGKIAVAMDEKVLLERLNQMQHLAPGAAIGPFASPELIRTIRQFIGLTESEVFVPEIITFPVSNNGSQHHSRV